MGGGGGRGMGGGGGREWEGEEVHGTSVSYSCMVRPEALSYL